ncbi:MAG: hypothetical protein ACTSO9_07885 [Candidatus Helarchaeota archaeon]
MSEEDVFGAKEDVVLAIKNKLNVEKNKLYKLSIDELDTIFGLIYQDSKISPLEIAEIINNFPPEEIMPNIQKRTSEVAVLPEYYDECQDVRAGILVNIHEDYVGADMKNTIRDKLLEINDVNKLIELSQMNLKALQIALGIRPAPSVMSPKPVAVPEAPTPISTAPISVPETNISTTSSLPNTSPEPESNFVPFTSPSIPSSTTQQEPEVELVVEQQPTMKPPPDKAPDQIVAKRQAEVKEKIEEIEKILQKAKIHPNDYLSALEVLKRIHPNRLSRIIQLLKSAKKKDRVKLLCDWFVISQQIEEIEMLVTHWQGIQQGAGAFQAAIGMARFDNILEEISDRDMSNLIKRAQKAVSDVQTSQDINIRLVGVEEIKELASDLFRKYVSM